MKRVKTPQQLPQMMNEEQLALWRLQCLQMWHAQRAVVEQQQQVRTIRRFNSNLVR